MRNKKRIIKYVILSSLLLSLTGCNKNKDDFSDACTEKYTEDEFMYELVTLESTKTDNEEKTEAVIEKKTEATTEKITTETTTEEKTTETKKEDKTTEITTEEIVVPSSTEETIINSSPETVTVTDIQFDNFKADLEIIQKYIDKEDIDNLRKKGKEFFVKHVDFIFFGSEINGKTFDELSEESKQMTIDNFKKADELIMKYAPDYKEDIGEKYEIFKDFTKEKYNDIKEYLRNKVTDEQYDKYEEKKEKVLEKSSELFDDAKENAEEVKEKIKTLYNDWKEK